MRFKYYLRGIGIGVVLATLLLTISFYFGRGSLNKDSLTDEEIIARATDLGMVMSEDSGSLEENVMFDEEVDGDNNENNNEDLETSADATDSTEVDGAEADVSTDSTEASEDINEAEDDSEANDSSETSVTYVPFTVSGGQSSDAVAYNLYKAGLVDSAEAFNKYINSTGLDNRIQAGTFYIKVGSSYEDLVVLLVNKDKRTTSPPSE